ncbi:MAG: hypothetical protein JWM28_1010 [Chitinophagaceae bacterium]|nr:hypothetical protein [Chitinophagaceae bacterium]
MKLLQIILSTYLIFLSVVPCTDTEAGALDSETVISTTAGTQQQDNDLCSPLCVCSCCAGFSIASHLRNLPSVTIVLGEEPESIYFDPQIKELLRSFWQPPKV